MTRRRPRADEELERVHIWLFKSDAEFFREHFDTPGQIGFSRIIRLMLRRCVRSMQLQMNSTTTPLQTGPELDAMINGEVKE